MDGQDRTRERWKTIKQRLGFSGIGCCRFGGSPTSTTDVQHDEIPSIQQVAETVTSPLLVGRNKPMMNLAMALAAERNANEASPTEGDVKTLMRLIEETDGVDWKLVRKRNQHNGGTVGSDWTCCVCIDRSKGAAFIPCGHAFCRLCSRTLWTSRGSCPICNRSIIQVLDIF